eukprot:scaffold1276_cov162-Amphora_coffeaeformis.AAC.1
MLVSRTTFMLLPTMTSFFSSFSNTQTGKSSSATSNSNSNNDNNDVPSLKSYYQLVVHDDGRTSILKRDFVNTKVKGYSNTPQVIKQINPDVAVPTDVIFTALQGENPWHHPPAPQIVVCLGGGWYIRTNDGKRVDFLPGDVLYQDNTDNHPGAAVSDERQTKEQAVVEHAAQHFSGSLNGEPCDQMILQLELKHGPIVVTDGSKNVPNPF